MEPIDNSPTLRKLQALVQQKEAGTITTAEYERRCRQFWIELQHAASKEHEKIKSWAISSKKVRDETEYDRLCSYYHDAFGDSFHNFLTSIHAGAHFLTLNEKMLDDARLLELRFGGKIVSPEQAAQAAEAEEAGKRANVSQDDMQE